MASCPYLDYESRSIFGNSDDLYICKLCYKQMHVWDPQVKYTCNAEYGDEYEKCPVYQNS